jgi:uncharacterized membrane protein
MPKLSLQRLESVGRICFGLAMLALGATHLVYLDFVTRVIPPWPVWVPGRPVWACLVGAVLLTAGALITLGRSGTRAAALAVGTIIVLALLFLFFPRVAARPGVGGAWTPACKVLALAGGAFLIAGLYPGKPAAAPVAPEGLRRRDWLARVLLGGFLTLCGIQHFVYTEFVATLVPAWIPGHVFWTYFAGVALIAGGLGLVLPMTTRLAALLSGAMIFVWFLILHIPRAAAAGAGDLGEWSGVCESLAMAGVAFLIAGWPVGRDA